MIKNYILFLLQQQQQRSHVPKFGNWESDDNVPYTAYFDKARKGRTGGKMINPNDPMENPDLLVEQTPSAPPKVRVESEEPPAGQVRRTHERRRSREDNEFKQQAVGSPNRRPDQSSAVPKFGDWDENNPASADGYTHIFNKVREERLGGGAAGRSPGGSYGDSSARKHKSGKSSMSCCFPWGSK
ncbi:RPM1-interacting protein 4 [Linum perenne]